jgi:hypothetical protein
VTFTTDIYSLGCTLFHLVSGHAPYHGETPFAVMLKHVSAPIPELRTECSECTGALATVVQRMMAKTPSDRHQSYEELAGDLHAAYASLAEPLEATPLHTAVAENGAESQAPLLEAEQTAPHKKTRRTLLVALVCFAVVSAAMIFLKSGLHSGLERLLSTTPKTIDLLALVDPVRDRIESPLLGKINKWERDGPVLRYVSDGKAGKVVAPASFMASEYQLEIHYRRLDGSGQWHTDIPLPEKKVVPLIFDNPGQKMVHHKGLPEWPAGLPPAGKVIIRVKLGKGEEPDTLDFDLGDRKVRPSWKGRLKDVSRELDGRHPDFPTQPMPSLVSMKGSYEFTKWTVTVVQGTVDVLR